MYLTDAGPSGQAHRTAHSACCRKQFYQGFKQCQNEALRYFVEGEAMVASDPFCRRVMEHLSTVAQHFGPRKFADVKLCPHKQVFQGNSLKMV